MISKEYILKTETIIFSDELNEETVKQGILRECYLLLFFINISNVINLD